MTVVQGTILQGMIAGSTAAYLAGPEKKHPCTRVALQATHALLLVANTLLLAGSPLGAFGNVVKIVGAAIPPLAVGIDFARKEPLFSEKQMSTISTVYKASVVASSAAALVLGSPVFAAATISVLVLDALVDDKNELFSFAKKVGGFMALIGYGALSAAASGVLAGLNTLSAVIVGFESLSKVDWKAASEPASTRRDVIYVDSSDGSYPHVIRNSASGPSLKDVGQTLCGKGIWS